MVGLGNAPAPRGGVAGLGPDAAWRCVRALVTPRAWGDAAGLWLAGRPLGSLGTPAGRGPAAVRCGGGAGVRTGVCGTPVELPRWQGREGDARVCQPFAATTPVANDVSQTGRA
ncbi:hypothetical protein GCM10010233_48750 [Streptomyces pseudogriseolus]|nr:hypothetical protein GCM10010233_48750 [Streptomyces gancidicus]